MTLANLHNKFAALPSTTVFPTLFVGHGNPMNALEKNIYTENWAKLGKTLPSPHAILCISAHWLTEGTFVHIEKQPRTIHDFWGFPEKLHQIQYPCTGAPECALATQELIQTTKVQTDTDWGIDHGTWSVLHHMYPLANIPVFQLSIDLAQSTQWHYELAKELIPLRKKGILIIGSGNIVHNLSQVKWESDAKPYDWAIEFDEVANNLIANGDYQALIHYEKLGQAARLSIPAPDHYWPLIYTLGLQTKQEQISFPVTGIAMGSVSMRSVLCMPT